MAGTEEGCRALLEQTFLFRGVPQAVGQALADPRRALRRFGRGEIIYDPQRFERCLGILLEGRVQVEKGAVIMSQLRPGELFGAAALFNNRPDYATTLTALTGCAVLLLPQPLVEDLMAGFPAVGRNYVAYLSERIRFLSEKIEGFTAGGAERRLAQYLLCQPAELECSATGLARRLNVSRASLYRAFDRLAALGAIRREGKMVRILDTERLKQV